MNEQLREIAENIITHLESVSGSQKPHAQRLADIDLVTDILRHSLASHGFVQIVSAGRVLRLGDPEKTV